jgi:hypothetical protein
VAEVPPTLFVAGWTALGAVEELAAANRGCTVFRVRVGGAGSTAFAFLPEFMREPPQPFEFAIVLNVSEGFWRMEWDLQFCGKKNTLHKCRLRKSRRKVSGSQKMKKSKEIHGKGH